MQLSIDSEDGQPSGTDSFLHLKRLQWLVLIVSVLITLLAWKLSLNSAQVRMRAQFEGQVDYSIDLFKQQMQRYADVLTSSVGFIAGSEEVRPDEWRSFTEQIALAENFPAFEGLGVAYRVEQYALSEFLNNQRAVRPDFTLRSPLNVDKYENPAYSLPLTLVAPQALESQIPGLDISRESRRRETIQRSISTGKVQVSAPIIPHGTSVPGFVIVAPIFTSFHPPTLELRQEQFIGAVVAAVVTKNLAGGILDSGMRQVAMKVSDNSDVMYNELKPDNENLDEELMMIATREVEFFGRNWSFEVHSNKTFHLDQQTMTPNVILLAGLIIDALLLMLFVHMSRENHRSATYGREITEKYEIQSKKLEAHCHELEAFSYLVSHDLKAPLRAIGWLAECFEEDFDEHHPDVTLHPEIAGHLNRINKQVSLSQGLIKGVLQYSGLDSEPEIAQDVDVEELLRNLQVTLTVEESQLRLIGEFPVFNTHRVQLTQVFMNLISNAYKYHHGKGMAVVTIEMEASTFADFYRFKVSDNGPGIKQQFHEKIFEPFATLQPKDHSMSSGVGLAIVRKLVARHGGQILLASDVDQGASFSFDWPCSIAENDDASESAHLPKAA